MILPTAVRRTLASALALIGAFALVAALAQVEPALDGGARAGAARTMLAALAALTAASWWAAFRFNRAPRSRAVATGHIVLFETPMPGVTLSHTPALTIRGPRDAVERFIPFAEFEALFGGWALWAAPARPTPEMPGEALGVWSRRTCKRFRRILRERGATLEIRREPGPAQRLVQLVARPGDGR